ncbi:hypothetical protein PLEI_1459 [Photobacterium leiognathi lrivu.4.1]|uniref:Uncharacterized protein n=1 Tax=Photobacterium leiognathi lrivu.4.1 TaxID=1248232 RepID=A0A0U1P504_PHOLE|nr:hypothetical protein [Photobacterium leiognathi]GAD29806.1 hypothetical protein PLEI_1459 [Photobacterium leiognathi lrivu.4.1]
MKNKVNYESVMTLFSDYCEIYTDVVAMALTMTPVMQLVAELISEKVKDSHSNESIPNISVTESKLAYKMLGVMHANLFHEDVDYEGSPAPYEKLFSICLENNADLAVKKYEEVLRANNN